MPDVDLARPLPVAWDGRALEWGPFRSTGPIFICDRSKRKHDPIPRCDNCGSQRPPLHAIAKRSPKPGDSEPGEYLRTHPRTGKRIYAQDPTPPYRDLHASRCVDCGHDVVYDSRTNEAWDLDKTDYGPQGSRPPDCDCIGPLAYDCPHITPPKETPL